jgi:hypothetical protein
MQRTIQVDFLFNDSAEFFFISKCLRPNCMSLHSGKEFPWSMMIMLALFADLRPNNTFFVRSCHFWTMTHTNARFVEGIHKSCIEEGLWKAGGSDLFP